MGLYEGQGQKGGVNWVKVSEHMGGTRSPQQCTQRWNGTLKPRSLGVMKSKGCWTDAEVIYSYILDLMLCNQSWLNQRCIVCILPFMCGINIVSVGK